MAKCNHCIQILQCHVVCHVDYTPGAYASCLHLGKKTYAFIYDTVDPAVDTLPSFHCYGRYGANYGAHTW